MNTTIADTAWMAGLFEGEGSISISQKKGYCYLQLVSTDHDVLLKFARLADCINNKITYSRVGLIKIKTLGNGK